MEGSETGSPKDYSSEKSVCLLGRLPKQEKRSLTNHRPKIRELYLFEDTNYVSKKKELYFLKAPKLGDTSSMAHRIIVPKKTLFFWGPHNKSKFSPSLVSPRERTSVLDLCGRPKPKGEFKMMNYTGCAGNHIGVPKGLFESIFSSN